MKFLGLLCCLGFLGGISLAQKYPCLPSDVRENSVVRTQAGKKITVGQTLKKLKARCSHGKLVDGKRKSVTFFKLQGCWGNPPADYLEILDRQRDDLRDLKKKYTVIEMTCDPGGAAVKLN